MQRRYSKKMLTSLILSLLVLLVLPVSLASGAIGIPTLSPSTGAVGTVVVVSGTGATAFGRVRAYWDSLESEISTAPSVVTANSTGGFKFNVTVPEDVAGAHYVIVKDVVGGSTAFSQFTITPEIVLSVESGLPADTVKVNGTGFAASSNMTMLFENTTLGGTYSKDVTATKFTSSAKGSFSLKSITVPTDVVYGNYNVTVKDASANTAKKPFKVGATITLTPEEGPTGTVVSITGRGFTKTADLTVTVKIAGTAAPVVAAIKTKADGTFSGQFIVPTLTLGSKTVNATDASKWATLSFEVTGTSAITLTPTSGAPGESITIEGINYTAVASTAVTVKFAALSVKTLYTNSSGGFKGTFSVPSMPTGPYTVTATDANGLTANTAFTLAITLVTLSPEIGPTGKNVTIVGYGFTGALVNITLGTHVVKMNIPVAQILGGTWFIVPTVSVGTYTVKVDDSNKLSASKTFQVNATTTLTLTPSSAPTGYNVKIEGNYFKPSSTVDLVWYNTTGALWTKADIPTGITGNFTLTWTVNATIGGKAVVVGAYKFNATDDYVFPTTKKLLLLLEVPFNVILPTVEMYSRAAEYVPGDIVSFYIKSTFAVATTIKVKDPVSITTEIPVAVGDWTSIGDFQYVKYEEASFTLPSDAKLGTWTWQAVISNINKTGTFTVTEKATLGTIQTRIADLEESLTDLSKVVDELSETVSGQAADITALKTAVSDLKTAINALKTDVANVASAASDAKDAATEAASAGSEAASSASEAASAASEAAEAANAAQATAAGISTAVYGAMVLSLVAAIAAIVAVITLQRKVAG